MTINNEQLRRENDILKIDNAQLRTSNDAMKDEIGQLTTLLDEMAVNSENQRKQTNPQSSVTEVKIGQLKEENQQLKVSHWSGTTQAFYMNYLN